MTRKSTFDLKLSKAVTTIRKPKESEFKESAVYGAVRETHATASTVSHGLLNFLFLAVLIFIIWQMLFAAFLPFIHALLSADVEGITELFLPAAMFCVCVYVVTQRIRRRSKEMRFEQLGEATAFAGQPDNLSVPHQAQAQPTELRSQLKFSRKAITSKAILLAFVTFLFGGLSFGEPGMMMLIAAYYGARVLVLTVNISRPQLAFDFNATRVEAIDLVGNKKTICRDRIISIYPNKSPFWDVVTPLLLGTRAFVEIPGNLPDGSSIKLRIPYKMIGVRAEDVIAIFKQSEVQEQTRAQDDLAKRTLPIQASTRASVRPAGLQSNLPEVRASFGRKNI